MRLGGASCYGQSALFRLIPIEELSAGQINVLRKLSLVKLTALIELYKGKVNL